MSNFKSLQGSIWDRTPRWGQILLVIFFIIYFGGGLLAGTVGLIRASHGADLDLPPIIKYGVNPPKYQLELCLETGKSFVGQVLKPDKTCKSGFRWMYQE